MEIFNAFAKQCGGDFLAQSKYAEFGIPTNAYGA